MSGKQEKIDAAKKLIVTALNKDNAKVTPESLNMEYYLGMSQNLPSSSAKTYGLDSLKITSLEIAIEHDLGIDELPSSLTRRDYTVGELLHAVSELIDAPLASPAARSANVKAR